MQLFPDRERRERFFAFAVIGSLLLHLAAGAVYPHLAPALAHEPPSERVVAKLDPISIERMPPTPTPAPTPTPPPRVNGAGARHAAPAASQHRLARVLAATPRPVPTLAPLPPRTLAHTRTVFHQPVARRTLVPAAGSRRALLAPNQIAAYEGAFQRTISRMHAEDGAAQGASGASGSHSRAQELLGGTFGEHVDFGGTCNDYAPSLVRGGYVYHYLTCRVSYSDGFTELASYPWPFRFPADADPIATGGHFPEATPPPGYALPPDFAPSRRVCTLYHAACAAKLAPDAAAAPP